MKKIEALKKAIVEIEIQLGQPEARTKMMIEGINDQDVLMGVFIQSKKQALVAYEASVDMILLNFLGDEYEKNNSVSQ